MARNKAPDDKYSYLKKIKAGDSIAQLGKKTPAWADFRKSIAKRNELFRAANRPAPKYKTHAEALAAIRKSQATAKPSKAAAKPSKAVTSTAGKASKASTVKRKAAKAKPRGFSAKSSNLKAALKPARGAKGSGGKSG